MNINNFLALDLSLSNSGGCVFENGEPIYIFSIPTSSKMEHRERLKIIGDFLLKIKERYQIKLVIFENGFSRFSASTQAIYKVTGVASYIYAECEQVYYPPSTVKKAVTGSGRADKIQVEECLKKRWEHLKFSDNDQSDACAVGLCYILKNKEL